MEKIYVIGHKSPDLDSVVAAITYADFKNKKENTEKYIPAVAGEINQVTEFVLEKYGFAKPEILTDDTVKVILVDHNEISQRFSDVEDLEIEEVLDHHKLNFSYGSPIPILVKAWGSTTSIIYKKYQENNIEINEKLAGLMLSAVLDDTVITKSPTCTETDKEIIAELSEIAGIKDWQAYGIEMFKVKSSIVSLDAEEIIKLDFKDFEFKSGIIGAGQVETVDLAEVESRQGDLIAKMEEIKSSGGYHSVILMITDILKEGSLVLVVTDESDKIEQALDAKLDDNKVYIEGLLSRKKQLTPNLTKVLDK